MSNFADILNKQNDDIERPKPLPVGTYLGIVSGPPEIGPIGQKQTLAAKYSIKLLAPQADVDQSALMEMGGIGERSVTHTLFLTADAAWRAKEFLEHCGVETSGKTLGESLAEAPGRQVMVKLKHRPSPDGTQLYTEIAATAQV